MSRFKTFDSTGIATGGRLYAGDLNSIQDRYADLTNFAQTVDANTFRIGEAALQLLRYGAGESRLTGHFRTDGIIRGLGGLYAGAYTTAQRDAIPLGQRPYGLIILNTNTNRLEFNSGSDATPTWTQTGQQQAGEITFAMLNSDVQTRMLQPGMMVFWPYGEATIPSGCAALYGQNVSRSANPVNHAAQQNAGYPDGIGDGSTTFGLPDFRGRGAFGKDNMGGVAANRISAANNGTTVGGVFGNQAATLDITQIPNHDHGGGAHYHTVNSHSHGGGVGGGGGHNHGTGLGPPFGSFVVGLETTAGQGSTRNSGMGSIATTSWVGDHGHGITAEAPGTGWNLQTVVTGQGGGGSHPNLPPGRIGCWIVKLG